MARVPGSTSFPSGHAASAFAFAVGCGLEVPALSLPLGSLATAVAYSRVRTRVHYPADVVAGVALGAGIALATRPLWPVTRDAPAVARRISTNIDGDALADGTGLTIVVNPSAGRERRHDVTSGLREGLPNARIISVDDAPIDEALARAADAPVLGIVGGDGSINAAAQTALAAKRPLAVIPGGTLNHFARDLGIQDAAGTIAALQAGELVAVDVGVIDGRPFLNTASFGSYPEFVDTREKLEPRIGKWPAALVAASKVLRRAEPLHVELNGLRRSVWMIFIGNCEYQPAGLVPSSRARLDDGLLDVRYIDASSRFSRIRVLGALAAGQLARANKVFTRVLVESLDVHSLDGPLRLARDGETFDGGADVRIAKHRDRLAVYAPHQEPRTRTENRNSRQPNRD
jgi:undecaprenyl-diphosphatase